MGVRGTWLGLGVLAAAAGAAAAGAAADEAPTYERVGFAVERGTEVENDRVRAVLFAHEEGDDPAELADRVNRTMAWALEQVRAAPGVTGQTGSYATQPRYLEKDRRLWMVSQELALETGDPAALRGLLGTLQERLQLRGIGFEPSDAKRRAAEDAMIREALAAFRARAELVRESLGFAGWRLVDLQVGGGAPPVPMLRQMGRANLARESVAAPALEAGTSEVRVTAHGTIQLER